MDLIYTAVLFVMIFMNIAIMILGVRLLSVIFCFITLGVVAQAWSVGGLYEQIPYSPMLQLLTGLVAVVCLLIVGVRGRHFGD